MRLSLFGQALIGIAILTTALSAVDGSSFLAEGNYKEAAIFYQEQLKTASISSKGEIKKNLAIALYKDQDQEQAFRVFLEALDEAQIKTGPSISDDEKKVYECALKIYLNRSSLQAQETAKLLMELIGPVIKKHPDYHLLGFFIAAANANTGHFDDFFNRFYNTYQYFPDHYLVFKTKAILYIKLFERSKTEKERELRREKILENTIKAIEKNSRDESLYKLMIVYAKEDAKEKTVITYLNKIINSNIIIPRADIAFYVQQAVLVCQLDLAQHFIDKAREWYQFSKVINAAQQFLDSHHK